MGIGLTILECIALCPIVYSTELCLRNVAWGTRICLHSEKSVCARTRTCAYAHIARSTGMKNTTSKLCNLEIATPKINGAKVATVETKGAKHLSSFCFFPISSCSLPKPLEGVNVQICRNYPATPTIDTSHQLRLTLNWVSHLQFTYYCNISIYLLCMCIHTYLHAHPVGSRFSPSCGF